MLASLRLRPLTRIIQPLFILLVFLQCLDFHSTYVGLINGRLETNAQVAHFISTFGLWQGLAKQKLMALGILFALHAIWRKYRFDFHFAVLLLILALVYGHAIFVNYYPTGL